LVLLTPNAGGEEAHADKEAFAGREAAALRAERDRVVYWSLIQ
jgi:hypothetical protein